MDIDYTASGAYGFASYTNAYPGGMNTGNTTASDGPALSTAGIQKLAFGHHNPLFWVLVLFLIVTSYLTVGFDIGLKKVGNLKVGT